jgi:hypothetical protein
MEFVEFHRCPRASRAAPCLKRKEAQGYLQRRDCEHQRLPDAPARGNFLAWATS